MNEGEKAKKTRAPKAAKKTPEKVVVAAKAPTPAPVKESKPKAPKKKAAPKKAVSTATTTVVAKADIGFGNTLFLRGTGPGLSWEKGVAMTNTGSDEWIWSTTKATEKFVVKPLINDELWAIGDDTSVELGSNTISPEF